MMTLRPGRMREDLELLGINAGTLVPSRLVRFRDLHYDETRRSLSWSMRDPVDGDPVSGMSDVLPDAQILIDFLNLHRPSDVERFAKRWGILNLCGHGRPFSHDPSCKPLWLQAVPAGSPVGRDFEPIDPWLSIAGEMRTVLDYALGAAKGDVRNVSATGLNALGFSVSPRSRLTPRSVRFLLGQLITRWIREADAYPRVEWPGNGAPRLVFTTSLYACLVLQLVTMIGREAGFAICSECGVYYRRTRRPAWGRENFCQVCGRKAGLRRAQQRRRDKLRRERIRKA